MADVVTNTPLELMQYVLTKYGNSNVSSDNEQRKK